MSRANLLVASATRRAIEAAVEAAVANPGGSLAGNGSEWMDESELAAYIKKSPRTIQRMRLEGGPESIPYTKVGGSVRYHRPTVERWLLSRLVSSTADRLRGAA